MTVRVSSWIFTPTGNDARRTLVDDNLSFHFDATTFSSLTDTDNASGSRHFLHLTGSGLTATANSTYTLKFTTKRPPPPHET